EIHLSVQKSSLCKFPRFGRPCPVPENSLEHFAHYKCSAVTVYLNGVLTCKSSRSPHHRYENLINHISIILYMSVMYGMALHLGYSVSSPVNSVCCRKSIRSAYTDNTYSGICHSCRNR